MVNVNQLGVLIKYNLTAPSSGGGEEVLQNQTTTLPFESTFAEWARPPGATEQKRCENAETSIKNAVRASAKLRARRVEVSTHGSYANRTNTPGDSDVDIGVLCNGHGGGPSRSTARSWGLTLLPRSHMT